LSAQCLSRIPRNIILLKHLRRSVSAVLSANVATIFGESQRILCFVVTKSKNTLKVDALENIPSLGKEPELVERVKN
jgi:hypothetical protein